MKSNVFLCLFLVGCGGSPAANTCATPGASYLEQCAQESGTCGPVPDQVINISPDGQVMGAAGVASCTSESDVGCVSHKSGCADTVDGTTATSTSETTFAADGSSAKGIITLAIDTGSASCVSTYICQLTRQ